MRPDDLAWQAFRVSLLSPLITGEIPHEKRESYFQTTAQLTHHTPAGPKTISVRTLRRWYQAYRQHGLDGLQHKRRCDRGQPRPINREKVDRAEKHKRDLSTRSDLTINKLLQAEFSSGLAPSTMYRHFRLRGATKKQLGVSKEKVRCRWTREHANSLWMGDFSHGPEALIDGHVRQTYLSVWIDAYSRFLVAARYYPRENSDCLIDSLLRAWGKYGASRELYADNGKIYHANGLMLACAKLAIRKLHRPPYEPEPGGLVERVFQTIRSQFAAEVQASRRSLTLSELNQALQAYLDSAYHRTVHSETGQSPHARYFTEGRLVQNVAISSVQSYFQQTVVRRVDPTHSDVRIDNRFYQVDPKWRGLTVYVRFDLYLLDSPHDEVAIYSEQDIFLGVGKRYKRERGRQSQSTNPNLSPPEQPDRSPVLDVYLDQQHKQTAESQQGIDYRTGMRPGRLSLGSLANVLCKHLGRAGGGLSAFEPHEQSVLESLCQRYPQVSLEHVQEAAKLAPGESFTSLLQQLENLLKGEIQ